MSNEPVAPRRPLEGRTVVVACSAKKIDALGRGLSDLGAQVIPFPVIEAKPVADMGALDRALAALDTYDWLVFTSAYGVSFFVRRMGELGMQTRIDALPAVCAIGPATAAAASDSGLRVDLVPAEYIAEGVVQALRERLGGAGALSGRRFLIARALEGRDTIPVGLRSDGALVDVVPCYQTVCAEPAPDLLSRIHRCRPDLIVFTSPSAVRNMVGILGQEDGKRMLRETVIAVIGPVTREAVFSFGKLAEIIPRENTIAALLNAVGEHYRVAAEQSSVRNPQSSVDGP